MVEVADAVVVLGVEAAVVVAKLSTGVVGVPVGAVVVVVVVVVVVGFENPKEVEGVVVPEGVVVEGAETD